MREALRLQYNAQCEIQFPMLGGKKESPSKLGNILNYIARDRCLFINASSFGCKKQLQHFQLGRAEKNVNLILGFFRLSLWTFLFSTSPTQTWHNSTRTYSQKRRKERKKESVDDIEFVFSQMTERQKALESPNSRGRQEENFQSLSVWSTWRVLWTLLQ